MVEALNLLLILPILLSLIGLYFVLRIWLVWENIDKQVLKARVFLSEKFLIKNWVYVFITGAFITAHITVDFLQIFTGVISEPTAEIIGHLLHLMAILSLVLLAIEWHKLVKTIK
jgi:hypothetical protein